MKVTNLLTQEDRDMFDRIDRDCIAMHVVPPPKTFIELSVMDGDGIEVERYTDRAHSWVRNAYNFVAAFFTAYKTGGYGAGSTDIKRRNGTVAGAALSYVGNSGLVVGGASGNNSAGIVVGSGNSADAFDAHNLTSLITNGTTSGKLSYSAGSINAATYDDATKKYTCIATRVFNNNSGASIDVNECGLVVSAFGGDDVFLVCRDLLTTTVTVPNAGQLTVTYTIEMTFPA